jgi:hypothetical protein
MIDPALLARFKKHVAYLDDPMTRAEGARGAGGGRFTPPEGSRGVNGRAWELPTVSIRSYQPQECTPAVRRHWRLHRPTRSLST